jgi:MoaA/NifB/PqqE/SkfB family radical SAM enzyme
MNYQSVKSIEIEASTVCNSWCPICIRYTGRDDGLYLNPNGKLNNNIDLKYIEKVFSDPIIDERIHVDMIGTAGEPIAHPKFIEMVDIILHHRPMATFNIHTNGGVKNEKFFTALAARLDKSKSGKSSRVCFSLDGADAETNSKYRIGVDWDKAIRNMQSFIAAGGNATWQYVVFPWNKHQVEIAKNAAFEMGCFQFETRDNVDPDSIEEALECASKGLFNVKATTIDKEDRDDDLSYDYIDDMCYSKQGVFLNPEGELYPCCMYSAAQYDWFEKKLLAEAMQDETYSAGWNHLDNTTVSEYVNSPWWNWLHKTINGDGSACRLCARQCGAFNDKKARSNISEVTYEK